MAPLAWELCMQAGVTPLLIPFSTWAGSLTMGFASWTANGAKFLGFFDEYFPEVPPEPLLLRITVWHILFFTLAFAAMFIICKGWKVQKSDAIMQKPEAFNDEQKRTLAVVVGCIAFLLVPAIVGQIFPNPVFKWMKSNLTMPVMASIGISVLCLFRCGDLRKVMSTKVGWPAIWTITGMGMYCGLAEKMGVIDALGNMLQTMPKVI